MTKAQMPGGTGILITPVAGFPPTVPVTIDLTGLADVLGRPFVLTSQAPPLVTTATVTDLSFTTAPPAGATAGTIAGSVADGMLVIGQTGAPALISGLVALGDPGANTKVRVRASLACGVAGGTVAPGTRSIALVGAQGEVTPLALVCGPLQDIVVDRPAAGPLWLSVALSPQLPHPQFLAFPGGVAVQIDAVTFE